MLVTVVSSYKDNYFVLFNTYYVALIPVKRSISSKVPTFLLQKIVLDIHPKPPWLRPWFWAKQCTVQQPRLWAWTFQDVRSSVYDFMRIRLLILCENISCRIYSLTQRTHLKSNKSCIAGLHDHFNRGWLSIEAFF